MPSKVTFRVAHVSGQDDQYKATELNAHTPTTKGWQSSRFCLYPQDIVMQLDTRARLRKIQILSHQYLIATKIEFYVGDVPDGIPMSLQNARYTRLGYVALSDNEKTGFKARELKSVHVDAVGVFIKFVIHKNHVNKHNLYNQVGIIALNVIGEDLRAPNSSNPYPNLADDKLADLSDPSLAGLFNRPDYISPLDDLAFDMYQDPEVAQVIRKLERKKQDAVLQERYDYAKKLKSAIQDLQKVGEKLGKYEVEKRQAVEGEDYDRAALKKVQMDEYRLQVYKQLELYDLLEVSGPLPQPQTKDSDRVSPPPRLPEIETQVPSQPSDRPPRTPYDEKPLPGIKNLQTDSPDDAITSTLAGDQPADERPLPTAKGGLANDDDELPEDSKGTGEPEPMSEKDQREAGFVIDVFGLPLTSKAHSKTWSFREDALLEVYKQMQDLPLTSKEEARNMLKAATLLISKAIKDKIFAVYRAALNLLKMILTEYIPKHKIPKSETVSAVEKTLPPLVQKTGDTAARNRDEAKKFILEESKFPEVRPTLAVIHECVKPFKLSVAPRLGLSRTELVDALYKEHGLTNSGLTPENIMRFTTIAIQHTAGEVREKAERIIIALYKEVGTPVKDYLPPDDEKTRKNVLYKQLFEAFDRIDGKPSKDDIKKQKDQEEQAKKKEVEELQQQLQQLKDMAAGKTPANPDLLKDDSSKVNKDKKDKKNAKSKVGGKEAKADTKADDDDTTSNAAPIDHTCIFCGEINDLFTEEGLDLHYWKNCPMLKRCSHCKQVVEISGLSEHLVSECDSKDKFKKCSRCSEAIMTSEYDQHTTANSCNPAEASKNHCPLCHQNVASGDAGWKNHLMGKDGCKQNPRRLQALNKPAATKGGGAKTTKPPSKIPPPSKGGSTKPTPRK